MTRPNRRRLQPAWVATIRVSIPITTDASTIDKAQQSVRALSLPDGATVEIISQNFGRMPVTEPGGNPTPAGAAASPDVAAQSAGVPSQAAPASLTPAMAEPTQRIAQADVPSFLDRRVPRMGT